MQSPDISHKKEYLTVIEALTFIRKGVLTLPVCIR